MKVAPGDIVHVKGMIARCPADGLVAVHFGGEDRTVADVWIAECDIVHVEHSPFKVGDAVACGEEVGVIVAIDAGQAWIRGGGIYQKYGVVTSVDKLKRAPQLKLSPPPQQS